LKRLVSCTCEPGGTARNATAVEIEKASSNRQRRAPAPFSHLEVYCPGLGVWLRSLRTGGPLAVPFRNFQHGGEAANESEIFWRHRDRRNVAGNGHAAVADRRRCCDGRRPVTADACCPRTTDPPILHQQFQQLVRLSAGRPRKEEKFTKKVSYPSSYATAEWIEETPLIIGTNAGFAALPNLTRPVFDHGTVNGATAKLKPSERINLVGSNSKVIGAPSAPDPDLDGFNACAWANSCSAPSHS
jgi:hypothetical protein